MADIAITTANVLPSAQAVIDRNFPFGAATTQGQSVYLDTTSTPYTWKLVDSNAASTGNELTTKKGIAVNAGAAGQPAAVCISDPDFTVGGTLTPGSALYTSTTAGAVTHDVPITGAYPTFLGLAKSAAKLNLRPCSTGVLI